MANVPVNKELYARVKAEAKRKFTSWPSAYGSAWLVKEYKKRGGKYTMSKRDGGMSDAALNSMQSFYKDMQEGKYNPTLMQNSLNDLSYLQAINPGQTYLKNIKSGTGETLYKGPGLFSRDPYVLDKNINIQTHFGPRGERLYKNMYELDQPGFAPTNNSGYSNDTPEGTLYMMDASGNDYSVRPQMKTGGIPERYKNMGFTKVGVKKKSTRPGKKWMVLAKKGNKYKVVHGGDNKMQDFKQHGSADRKKRFWDRMGGRDSAKAQDPFSPLYWHKKFGTWQEGGQFIYDQNNPMPQFEMGNSILDKMKRETMRKGGQPCYECGGMYAAGGTNNPGFRALPPDVQQKIRANMNSGGMTPFNADPNYYGERLEKFIGNIRNTAAENLFPDMQEEVMAMPQARYGMPIYQGDIDGSTVNSVIGNQQNLSVEDAIALEKLKRTLPEDQGGTQKTIGNYTVYPNHRGDYIVQYGDQVVSIVPKDKAGQIFPILEKSSAPTDLPRTAKDNMIMVPENERDQAIFTGAPLSMGARATQALNMLNLPLGQGNMGLTTPYEDYINENYGEGSASQSADNEYGLIGGFAMPGGFTTISPMAGGARTANTANRAITSGRQALPFNTQAVARPGQLALSQQPGRFGSRVNLNTMPDWAMRASTYVPGAATGALNLSEYETYQPNNLTPEQQAQIAEAMNMPINGGAGNSGAQGNNNYQGINWLPTEPEQNQNDETIIPSPQQTSSGPTVAQRFEDRTGLDWSEARDRGLTDGSAAANLELIRRIEAGESIEEIAEDIPTSTSGTTSDQTYQNTEENEEDAIEADYGNMEDEEVDDIENSQNNVSGNQGMYPQYYGNPYLQRARYKYGPLGGLRHVNLQYGIPGQQQGMVPTNYAANAGNVTPDALVAGMTAAGMMSPQAGRRAQRQALREMRQDSRDKLSGMRQASRDLAKEERMDKRNARFENRMQRRSDRINDRFDRKSERIQNINAETPFVNQSTIAEPTSGALRGTDRYTLQKKMEDKGIKYGTTEGQRFEGYNLIALPDGQYEYRPIQMYGGTNPYTQMYGGTNPYMEMYKQGGEYYMDEDTINMILAMGGDIEFLD